MHVSHRFPIHFEKVVIDVLVHVYVVVEHKGAQAIERTDDCCHVDWCELYLLLQLKAYLSQLEHIQLSESSV